MGPENSMKIQKYLETRSKMMDTLSNTIKKASDTDSGIISNLLTSP